MKKRQHMLLPLTAVALLLSGCGTAERISNTEKDATATLEKARRHAGELRKSRPVVTETTRQWINPSPVSVSPAHQSLPGCPIIINTRRDISLRQIAQRITGSCGIPVTITADVWQALATTGPTQQLTGAIPAPDPNGMVPLAAVGSG
ncbi:TPA: PilN family type IVB pilus formation outer membrane protein, partial [Escherichia coli]